MKYADYTRNSKGIKGIIHGSRFSGALGMIPLDPSMKVLDYGCGDGGFFEDLSTKVPAENLYGYDPYLIGEMEFVGATTYVDADVLTAAHPNYFDAVYCMEVCEHLTDGALHDLFDNLRRVGKADAAFVFGVPIETGISGFVKNSYRLMKGRSQRATFSKLLRSLFAIPIPRAHDKNGWIGSHIGFDHNYFREMLDYGGFTAKEVKCLPVPITGSVVNNEIYFICRRNKRHL